MSHKSYISPFELKYASKELLEIFSSQSKYSTWRKLWLSLAKREQQLGLPISNEQILELEASIYSINFDRVKHYEVQTKHEVMAHIMAFGEDAPKAKPIIHLGATSSFVMDNTDLILFRKALEVLSKKLLKVLNILEKFARKHSNTACLSYTHFQKALPTTFGKRACLWLQDLVWDYEAFVNLAKSIPFLGVKGATGTSASFIKLFDRDFAKVKELEKLVALDFGFEHCFEISSQTYTRKLDVSIFNALSSFASTSHKIGTDIRLLTHTGELTEGFTKNQIGSSAMPFKRNPIFSERICSLSRFVISLASNGSYTHALQWLERSLDDSANRRLSLPEAFLGVDSILNLLTHTFNQLTVNESKVSNLLDEHLLYIIQEDLLMLEVARGADRQTLHEILKQISLKAYCAQDQGIPFDFKKELLSTEQLTIDENDLESLTSKNSHFGVSNLQCLSYLDKVVAEHLNDPTETFSESQIY